MNKVSANEKKNLANFSLDKRTYHDWYQQSLHAPEVFWRAQAECFIQWHKPFSEVVSGDFAKAQHKWFVDGKLNVCVNCVDKHLAQKADKPAFIWVADNASSEQMITYRQLHKKICEFGNTLREHGVKKGETVCIYMPMLIDSFVAILACARIGAVHSVVFGGFSPQALQSRLQAANCRFLITADGFSRGGKTVLLKPNVDEAVLDTLVERVIVVQHCDKPVYMQGGRDVWYHEVQSKQAHCEPEIMDAEDPLFILYTSGSTGKPKGIVHTSAGYLLYAAMTFRYVFDYHAGDIYWCTADIGWITGHTYGVYGPLALGATSVIYEGVPTGPDPALVWKIVDRYQVNIFYTAPTAIRALMAHGDEPLNQSTRKSLRILGTVGEPINPEAWRWYHEEVGNGQCWIVDTWWQTETGGVALAPLPYISAQKPGAACLPFFGIEPKIENVTEENGRAQGQLVLTRSWPGQSRTIYGDHQRYLSTYMSQVPGAYFTGDGALVDKGGDYWILGRVDDVLNVSGHRLGTAEIESALVEHELVSEAAVVGVADDIKGEIPYAYVCLVEGVDFDDKITAECQDLVTKHIGKFALPNVIQWAPDLPKTRSGKIMRRLLRQIAKGDVEQFGDTSTLANPDSISKIIAQKP